MEFENYFKVLKVCEEEPGTIKEIYRDSGLSVAEIDKALQELQDLDLLKEENNIWSTTLKGSKVYRAFS